MSTLNFLFAPCRIALLASSEKDVNKGAKSFYGPILSSSKMRAAELLSELLLIGSRLQRTRNNEYYLVVPVVGGEIARKTPAKNSSSSILG